MITRTTISIESKLIEELQKLTKQNNYKSLSKFINDILKSYTTQNKKNKELQQMAKDYENYAKDFDNDLFNTWEKVALNDLVKK